MNEIWNLLLFVAERVWGELRDVIGDHPFLALCLIAIPVLARRILQVDVSKAS